MIREVDVHLVCLNNFALSWIVPSTTLGKDHLSDIARWRGASWVRYPAGFSVPGQRSAAFAPTPLLRASIAAWVLDIRMVQGTRIQWPLHVPHLCSLYVFTHSNKFIRVHSTYQHYEQYQIPTSIYGHINIIHNYVYINLHICILLHIWTHTICLHTSI